jgi:ATP-dependent DNA ligase
MTEREATLNERTRMYSRHTQRSAFPLRSPSFGAGQCLEPLTGKQAHSPCLPTKTDKLPSGSQWLHEIKHDGFRIIARKSNERVRLYSRPGNDFTRRFPLILDALARCARALALSTAKLSPISSRNRSHSRSN